MGVVKALCVLALLALVTPPLMAVQWLSVRLDLPAARDIPVLFHRIVLRLLGIRIDQRGMAAKARPLLLAANHVSWLDICVLGAVMPLAFIAKSEVGTWPLFGTFARLQRSVFVDRERRSATGRSASEIAARLADGTALVLFAEGTSSPGISVLPFRSALLGAVRQGVAVDDIATDPVVQPLAITYTRRGGLPLSRNARAHVAWYGDMDLAPHLWRVLTAPPLDVQVAFGAPVTASGSSDRKHLAAKLEDDVRTMVQDAILGRS
ncbi:MAG: lysophospholipid acyltransferase family protein [Pseudomonadota bacterium]